MLVLLMLSLQLAFSLYPDWCDRILLDLGNLVSLCSSSDCSTPIQSCRGIDTLDLDHPYMLKTSKDHPARPNQVFIISFTSPKRSVFSRIRSAVSSLTRNLQCPQMSDGYLTTNGEIMPISVYSPPSSILVCLENVWCETLNSVVASEYFISLPTGSAMSLDCSKEKSPNSIVEIRTGIVIRDAIKLPRKGRCSTEYALYGKPNGYANSLMVGNLKTTDIKQNPLLVPFICLSDGRIGKVA